MTARVLVTGIEGQLARSLAERALARPGLLVSCIGRPELDLEAPATIEPAIRRHTPDVIVNAAAYTAVDRAEDEPDLAMRTNGEAPGLLARAARHSGARLIHVSTDYVYDGAKSSPYHEDDTPAPQSVYGRSKLAGEQLVLAECPQSLVLRTAWIYSPFGKNFIRTMLDLARTRDRLTVVDDQYGNPTSALDLADAILAIIEAWRRADVGLGAVYHCAGTGDTTWCGLARHSLAMSGACGGPEAEVVAIASRDWPTKAARPANSRLDCRKLERDFGWRAPQWQGSVATTVERLLAAQADQP